MASVISEYSTKIARITADLNTDPENNDLEVSKTLDLQQNNIINVKDPSNSTDAVNKQYVDLEISKAVSGGIVPIFNDYYTRTQVDTLLTELGTAEDAKITAIDNQFLSTLDLHDVTLSGKLSLAPDVYMKYLNDGSIYTKTVNYDIPQGQFTLGFNGGSNFKYDTTTGQLVLIPVNSNVNVLNAQGTIMCSGLYMNNSKIQHVQNGTVADDVATLGQLNTVEYNLNESISSNSTNITKLDSDIQTTSNNVAALNTTVTQHSTDIQTNKNTMTNLLEEVGMLQTYTHTNIDSINSQLPQISTNTNDISSLNTKVTTIENEINNNTNTGNPLYYTNNSSGSIWFQLDNGNNNCVKISIVPPEDGLYNVIASAILQCDDYTNQSFNLYIRDMNRPVAVSSVTNGNATFPIINSATGTSQFDVPVSIGPSNPLNLQIAVKFVDSSTAAGHPMNNASFYLDYTVSLQKKTKINNSITYTTIPIYTI